MISFFFFMNSSILNTNILNKIGLNFVMLWEGFISCLSDEWKRDKLIEWKERIWWKDKWESEKIVIFFESYDLIGYFLIYMIEFCFTSKINQLFTIMIQFVFLCCCISCVSWAKSIQIHPFENVRMNVLFSSVHTVFDLYF